VTLNDEDIEAVLNGSLVTKVVTLEHPDRAVPIPTTPGQLIETTFPARTDLFLEGLKIGRPILCIHLGERVPTEEVIVRQNVPNTILLPGEKVVGPAAVPPAFPVGCMPFHDPIHGPPPHEEECLHDGGDRLRKAARGGDGELHGLDPEDTVAEYTDSKGRRHITCSNRVCICVPRFVVLRKELPILKTEAVVGPVGKEAILRQDLYQKRVPSLQATKYERPRGYLGKLRPGENVIVEGTGLLVGLKVLQAQQLDLGPLEYVGTKEVKILTPVQRAELVKQLALARELSVVKHVAGVDNVIGTGIVARVLNGPELVEAVASTRDITVCCNEAPCPPDKPLVLIKCADRSTAQVGDVVTFSLRYSNVGGKAITDVAVHDSLSGRLEYVEGSAQSDRDAVFTIQENEAGSVVLRWEVSGTLLPGQSGRLRFKARVR
jgi:uncharacterized repeat protein (TIGR01451 family)